MSTSTAINSENITSETSAVGLNPAVAYVTRSQAESSEKAASTAKGFNQASANAFAQSDRAFAAGSIEIMNQMAHSGQAALAETLAGLRSFVVARTANELFDLQTSLTRLQPIRQSPKLPGLAQQASHLPGKYRHR